MNTDVYRTSLEEALLEYLETVPLITRTQMKFQHDGAPTHFTVTMRHFLNHTFNERWIGRAGPITWPPFSPDLPSLDFL